MASKLAVAGVIEGNLTDEGLAAMSECQDLTTLLAQELTLGLKNETDGLDIRDVPTKTELPAKVNMETPKDGFHYSLKDMGSLFRVIRGIAQMKIDKNGTMLIRSKDELFLQLPRLSELQRKDTQKKTKKKAA